MGAGQHAWHMRELGDNKVQHGNRHRQCRAFITVVLSCCKRENQTGKTNNSLLHIKDAGTL